ncbi:ABC transporter permease [Aeromicrobium sp. CF3.5]|uniref:ABC transporter permease n=1 Tax=Aeromicrobium sp. CF3.5 TaxID=3373078 RepID=UPI003EE62844
MTWFLDNLDTVGELFWRHAWISVVSILIGFVVSLPIGWYANEHPRLRGIAVTAVGVLYTVPSLAIFVLLPGLLGTGFLSVINVVIALSTYAAAVMVRTTADAFGSVSPAVLDAASAAGFSRGQRVFRVELPLAGPVLLAGLRVVSVSTVSMLSVATLVGVSNLGSLFTDGFRRDFQTEIIVGILAIVVLALLLDLLLVLAGRLLMPWSRAQQAPRRTGRKVAA